MHRSKKSTGLQLQTLSQKCNGVDKLYISASFNKTTLSTKNAITNLVSDQSKEVQFANFFSGGFTTVALINPPDRELAKHTSVQCHLWIQNLTTYYTLFNDLTRGDSAV